MQAVRVGQRAGARGAGALLPGGADHVHGSPAGGHGRRLPALARVVVSRRGRRGRLVGAVHWDRDRARLGRRQVDEDYRAVGERAAPGRGHLHAGVRRAAVRVCAEQCRHGAGRELARVVDVRQERPADDGVGLRVNGEQDGRGGEGIQPEIGAPEQGRKRGRGEQVRLRRPGGILRRPRRGGQHVNDAHDRPRVFVRLWL